MRRTPLKPRRDRPRRDTGRVRHQRIKPKAGAPPTAQEARHIARVATLGCIVCGKSPTIHHVTASIHGGRIARTHTRIVPLCPAHHQHDHGPQSVERLGHGGFYQAWGIDLLEAADRLWKESCEASGETEEVP